MRNFLLIAVLLASVVAVAQLLDNASETAVKQTQHTLTDKKERAKAVKSGDAKKADDYANKIAHGNKKAVQKMYELSADLFPDLAKDGGGDSEKMQRLLEQYERDPSSLEDKMTPEQKAKLKEIEQMVGPSFKLDN